MAERIAIDGNVLVALIDSRDKWHVEASALLSALKDRGLQPVYFDCVLNETINVCAAGLRNRDVPRNSLRCLLNN